METTRSMISFDWAMKRLLRNKANFDVLEGFLSELLHRKIVIKNIVESEGNKTDADDKSNRVDILVEADNRELVIIELQFDSEIDYFHRMVYGVSKAITERMNIGDHYSKVRKVYSVNIVYFTLGKGDDYIYHGFNHFKGLHTNNELVLTATQKKVYCKTKAGDIFPEYFIIMVSDFDNIAKNTLDEWVYYLKNNKIKDGFKAQGIEKAKQILAIDNMPDVERSRYYRNIEEKRIKAGEITTALIEGEEKGLRKGMKKGKELGLKKGMKEGMKEGEEIGLKKGEEIGLKKGETLVLEKMVINSHKAGSSIDSISTLTELSNENIIKILKRNNLI